MVRKGIWRQNIYKGRQFLWKWPLVSAALGAAVDRVTPGCIPGLAAACCRQCPSQSLRRLFKAATGVVKSKVLQFPP